jgi:hypothetical protein
MWLSSCWALCWEDCLRSVILPLPHRQRSVGRVCVGLFLGFSFSSIGLFVLLPVPHILITVALQQVLKVGNVFPSKICRLFWEFCLRRYTLEPFATTINLQVSHYLDNAELSPMTMGYLSIVYIFSDFFHQTSVLSIHLVHIRLIPKCFLLGSKCKCYCIFNFEFQLYIGMQLTLVC